MRFPILIVVPITTDKGQSWADAAPKLYVRLGAGMGNLPRASIALLDQVRAIDESRVMSHRGTLTPAEYELIRNGLVALLGQPVSAEAR